MEVKDFVKSILIELDEAVSEASEKTRRRIGFASNAEKRVVEFDIAVSVDSEKTGSGGGSIKVFSISSLQGEGSISKKTSHVSRITFGLDIGYMTKDETARAMDIRQYI